MLRRPDERRKRRWNGGYAGASGAGAAPQTGSVGTWTPDDDGSVGPNGFATFVLDPNGAYPVVLRTLEKNVTKRAGGFGSDEGSGLESFQGSVRLPFPNIGTMGDSSVADPSDPAFFLRASLGGLMGPVDEASIGFSIGGHLEFEPTTT